MNSPITLLGLGNDLVIHVEEVREARRTGPSQLYILHGPRREMVVVNDEARVNELWNLIMTVAEP